MTTLMHVRLGSAYCVGGLAPLATSRHLFAGRPCHAAVWERYLQLFVEVDTMQTSMWHKTCFAPSMLHLCMNLLVTCKDWDPIPPSRRLQFLSLLQVALITARHHRWPNVAAQMWRIIGAVLVKCGPCAALS